MKRSFGVNNLLNSHIIRKDIQETRIYASIM